MDQKLALTQRMVDRWFSEADPLIRRLAALAERVEQARIEVQPHGNTVLSFIAELSTDLPQELTAIATGFVEAKGRLTLGVDAAELETRLRRENA